MPAQEKAAGRAVNVSMDRLCGETLGKSLPYMARGENIGKVVLVVH